MELETFEIESQNYKEVGTKSQYTILEILELPGSPYALSLAFGNNNLNWPTIYKESRTNPVKLHVMDVHCPIENN